MKTTILKEIKKETERFLAKLDAAIDRGDNDPVYYTGKGDAGGTKESGAVKRAALDLKNELTKITSPKQ